MLPALACVLLVGSAPGPDPAPKADPLAEEYAPRLARQRGTSAGQLRGSVALGSSASALQVSGLFGWAPLLGATFELMTTPFVGIRYSTLTNVPVAQDQPHLWSFVLGPALHLLPYRVVDLSLFVEAGVATVDLFQRRRTAMPELGAGFSFNVFLSAAWFVLLEGQLRWGVFERAGAVQQHVRALAVIGAGYSL